MRTAKLFRNGRSQAVRLPKEFRFEGEELSIRREGDAVILEPLRPQAWPKGYWRRWCKASLDLERIGRPIGERDLMIASVALARDLTVVTHNVGEFSRVPGLKSEDWH